VSAKGEKCGGISKFPPLARVKVPNGWPVPSSGSNDQRHLRPLWAQKSSFGFFSRMAKWGLILPQELSATMQGLTPFRQLVKPSHVI